MCLLPIQKLYIYIYIYMYIFGYARSHLRHIGSSIFIEAYRVFSLFSSVLQTLSCSMWDLVPWPGTELQLPALGVRDFTRWTMREVQDLFLRSGNQNELREKKEMKAIFFNLRNLVILVNAIVKYTFCSFFLLQI